MERIRLATIGNKIGSKALEGIANIVKPETIMKWYRNLIAKKYDGSKNRKPGKGRPAIDPEIEQLIVSVALENPSWGYDRIVGALSNLGYKVSDQTVKNVLEKHGIPPAPDRDRDTRWADFIKRHINILVACDFFTAEVITPAAGIINYYVLFFIHVGSREVYIAGATPDPDEKWMKQIARNITMNEWGFLEKCSCKYLIHDRDTKFTKSFRSILRSVDIKPLKLPKRSPNLNAFAERFVLSIKSECLSKFIFFGEESLMTTVKEFMAHYHEERNHQGKDNVILFPGKKFNAERNSGDVKCQERLGGLLKYYYREAA